MARRDTESQSGRHSDLFRRCVLNVSVSSLVDDVNACAYESIMKSILPSEHFLYLSDN